MDQITEYRIERLKKTADRFRSEAKALTLIAAATFQEEEILRIMEEAEIARETQLEAKPKVDVKPKAKPNVKSNTPFDGGVELPEPVVCKTTDGNEFNMYENTTCYLDKDTWKKCNFKNMTDLYNAMKKYKSCACEQFGNGNYLVKSPIGSKTMVKIHYPGGGGADYESIMKSLKHNKTAQNKKVKTFVFNWD